ncbi:MAG: MFS transporter [Bacteroidota bacterium]
MNKQLSALFLSNLSILFVGFGVFPLLPVYAGRFGATPSMIGLYLALTYIAISIGTMLPGWLSGRLSEKGLFVASGMLGVPALVLLGRASEFWQVVVLTGIVWFTGGVGLALISVFTGRSAAPGQRGRWFGLIGLTTPLGAVIGGSVVAWLVQAQGYRAMFAALGWVYALWPLAGVLLVQYKPVVQITAASPGHSSQGRPGRAFTLLILSVLLAAMTISISRLGLSLTMRAGLFSPGAIAGTNVAGGLVTMPLVLGSGLLSDRVGRRLLLAFGYLLAALSAVLLLGAQQLWQFWIVSAAVLVARSLSASMASALATDLLAPEVLGKALPRITSMNWVAGVVGFAGSGYVIEVFGEKSLYWMATLFSLAAAAVVGLALRRGEARVMDARLSAAPEGSSAD